MKIFNSILKKLSIPFSILALICMGIGFGLPNKNFNVNAEFSPQKQIVNNLPDYVKFVHSTDTGTEVNYVDNSVYLFQPDSFNSLIIADGEKVDPLAQPDVEEKKNYAYFPDPNLDQVFYYFDFTSSLSLYYNITADDVKPDISADNILRDKDIANYARAHTNPFQSGTTSTTPKQFKITFKLNTLASNDTFDQEVVTLHREGLYTLAIPTLEYYTNNNGLNFMLSERTIYYSFMIFNSSTYFETSSSKPKIDHSTNVQESSLISSSSYSAYYFYNYSYSKETNSLPTLSYDPDRFQIRIAFTDINDKMVSATIEYKNGQLVQLDDLGNELNESDKFIKSILKDDKAMLVFSEIGTYDIGISYLYKVETSSGTETYNLQFEKLVKQIMVDGNLTLSASNFQNKQQRLFIYGYQATYSNYSDIDPSTNQPRSVDLKTFDEFDKYIKSADITSLVNNYILTANKIVTDETSQNPKDTIEQQNPSTHESNGYDQKALYKYAQDAIESKNLEPVTTNQTPIKFLTNAVNREAFSKIYTLTLSESGTKEWQDFDDAQSFKGFNQNTAGTYLYIIQYTYDNFMSTNGTLQNSYFHYQIFYFTITNSSPTVEVINDDYQKIYTNGFTNKSVYILNDAENNIFDAEVTITLTAQNYKNGQYYFRDTNIKNLTSFGLQYTQFSKREYEEEPSKYNSTIANKYGIFISNSSSIANSKFTIKIISANSNIPSTRTFTIDTNQIENITSRNVSLVSSTVYKIGDTFTSYNTNQPIVLSWDEKASGAKTYGFVTYIPTKQINYYSKNDNGIQELLSKFITHNILPVSYSIDFKGASQWTEQPNSINYTTTIPATYVKTSDGFYILEVYDDAGNSDFKIFMIDSSAPIFVEEIEGKFGSTNKILTNSESISIPEDDESVYINWTAYKAIYLDHLEEVYKLKAYQYGIDVESANEKLSKLINEFFKTDNNDNIQNIDDISISAKEDNGENHVGIDNYNGYYLVIPVSTVAYIKNGFSSDYSSFNGTRYQVKFFDETGKSADNTTFKILIRDRSNTQTATNVELQYKNYPSAFVSFNVTADASKMMLKFEADDSNVEFSSFSFDGKLYSYEDEDGNTIYTYNSSNGETEYTETNKSYKFSYYTPINGMEELYLSYIPVAKNGSKLENVNLKYYPYIKTPLPIAEDTKQNKYGDSNYYWYYTLSEEATQTINIFQASDSDNFTEDEPKTFALQLGNETFPPAGKYVIERTYKENSSVGTYDYYLRTLSIIIDNNNLISPLESVTGADNTGSLESLVGGDIILSLYSGEGNSAIEVSFPKYSPDNGLSVGSFHTKDSFNDSDTIERFSISGNKLPMALYIPKYKYTIASVRSDKNGTIGYEVENNNALSTYGNTYYKFNNDLREYEVFVEGIVVERFASETAAQNYVKSSSIVEYQIYAEISYTAPNSNIPKYYASDSSNYTENGKGYLRFYEANGHFGLINTTRELKEIYEQGTYVVTIYQASNAGTTSKFYTLYKFGFEIISQAPSFDILNADGIALNNTSQPNIYYTNSNSLTFSWQIPTNEYQARIDEEHITITTNPRSVSYNFTSNDGKGNYIVDNNGSKYFTIDVSNLLNIEKSSISVTMQYYGHNSKYYSTLTKTVYFDKSAPIQNLQSLMNLTESATNRTISTNYQLLYMRAYYDYNGQEVTLRDLNDIKNMSYTYSLDSGYFKYFSYNVTTDFFENTLRQTIVNASSDNYNTQKIYYKQISNLNSYIQVDKDSFPENDYKYVTATDAFTLNRGYYEIIETDYAGNMTVYIVNLVNSTDPKDSGASTEAFTYENNLLKEEGQKKTVDESEIYNGANIYSRSGFNITSINYKTDSWEFFTLQLADGNSVRYMKSPWLDNSQIYRLSFPNGGLAFSQINLSSLFENVESSNKKHSLTLTDRITGNNITVYITIMDATLAWHKGEDATQTSAILIIDIPTQAQLASTTYGYIYPVKISIFQFDSESADTPWKAIMVANKAQDMNWPAELDFQANTSFIHFYPEGIILRIVINLGDRASQKIKYIIEDNFGFNITIIQLANEVSYREITGETTVYTINESEDTTITYLSSDNIHFSYNQLLYKVAVFDRQGVKILDDSLQSDSIISSVDYNTNITRLTFTHPEHFYDQYYKVVIYDSESNEELRTLHIRIYNKLPFRTNTTSEVTNGGIIFLDKDHNPIEEENIGSVPNYSVKFDGKDYFATCETITTFSRNVTLRFYDGGLLNYDGNYSYQDGYPYTVYLSRDNGITWENINNVNSDYTGYTIAGIGDYKILIKYDDVVYDGVKIFSDICSIYTITILDSSTASYYITVDGNIVERNTEKYYSVKEDKEYEINYIVSVDYSDKVNRLRITENKELKGEVRLLDVENTGSDVIVEKYYYTSTTGENYFAIIYIAETNNIVQTFTYESSSGAESDSLKDRNTETIAVNKDTEANYDRLKLTFSSYYGIKNNKINIEIQKLFNGQYVEIKSQVYQKDDTSSFIYLSRAGSYRIRIYDSCSPANVQTFAGSRFFNLTFLDYVPFIISQTKGSGTNAVTTVTEPIDKAVYNGSVTIQPTNVSSYYQASRTPQIYATLNGNEYTGYDTLSNRRYVFSQPGFYTIKFSATSIGGIPIREQEFSFTILNENESRYAYEFTEYSTYYIEKVEKIEGVGEQQVRNDITQRLLDITNFDRIIVDGVEHLAEININYKDEKTQKGRYSITVNINDPYIVNLVGERFTFDFWINMEKPPVIISVEEGEKTTDDIRISVNVNNLYNSVGDCYLTVSDLRREYFANNLSSYGEIDVINIIASGTYFVQVYSASGQLLFSYKIIKTEPLNAFAIIAIIFGVLGAGAIITITVLLRKKQKVK